LKASISLSYNGYTSTAISRYFNVFIEHNRGHIIEHFRRVNDAVANIPVSVDTLAHHLLFFPNLADSLSNLFAVQKFEFYSFNSLPKTVVDGSKRFQMPTNLADLNIAIEEAKLRRTFITRSICSIVPDSVNVDNLHLNLALFNDNTTLFEWSSNSAISPRLFIGLFKAYQFAGNQRFVLQRWLSFNEQISGTLDSGTSLSKALNINMANTDSQDNYHLYYWLQNTASNGGQVFYAHYTTLPQSSAGSDELIPVPRISIYPNPLRGNAELKINTGRTNNRISIYNLRGQRIFNQETLGGEISLAQSVFPSSGIYFLRIETINGTKPYKQTLKFSVIK